MKVKMLLLLLTLVIGALMILTAQSVPEYHDALFEALPLLAVVFSLVLMVLASRKKTKNVDSADHAEIARRTRTRTIIASLLGIVLIGALAMILFLPKEFILLPILLAAVVCVGSIGIAFWAERPISHRSNGESEKHS